MTSFINPDYPTEHQGVARMQAAFAAIRQAAVRFRGARGLVTLLLAGAASALVVVADQVIHAWADGQLLLAWIALWAMVFAALALFADATRGVSARAARTFDAWLRARRARDNEARTWAYALSDHRFMADFQAAQLRTERLAEQGGEVIPLSPRVLGAHRATLHRHF